VFVAPFAHHVGEVVGDLEGVDDRQHGGGLGFVVFERGHRQWESGRFGEQPDRDLRVQAAFLGVMPTSAFLQLRRGCGYADAVVAVVVFVLLGAFGAGDPRGITAVVGLVLIVFRGS
jgi:hypothetical protein